VINWKVRYAALLALEPPLSDPARRVLEVGSGSEGIARYLKRRVVGVDRAFDGPVNASLEPVRGSILALPFSSRAFDDVVCVDTLEHLDRADRPRALGELIRVARNRVIISGPAGAFAQWGDEAYAKHLSRRPRPLPLWLAEHLRHGIPSLQEVLELLVHCGHPFTIGVNEGALQHYAGIVADNLPFMAGFLRLQEAKLAVEPPLARVQGDVPYSYLITIDAASKSGALAEERRPTSPPHGEPVAPPKRAEIFAVGHRLDQMPKIPGIRRILAGAGNTPGIPIDSGVLRDDGGDSISDRNPDFSEMTAIYWVWKNLVDLDGVGFCHYRRYFDFRDGALGSHRETRLGGAHEVAAQRSAFVDRAVIERALAEGAILVTRTTQEGVVNAEQYMTAHLPEHYLAMVNCVVARHPHLARQLVAHVGDDGFYGNNMFVMPWADFDALCRYWFDCLFALDREIADKPAGYQRRVLAFLSERLFDIYVRWLCDRGRRVVEYPLFFLEPDALGAQA
jgi:SAM-dependent methyltransferase